MDDSLNPYRTSLIRGVQQYGAVIGWIRVAIINGENHSRISLPRYTCSKPLFEQIVLHYSFRKYETLIHWWRHKMCHLPGELIKGDSFQTHVAFTLSQKNTFLSSRKTWKLIINNLLVVEARNPGLINHARLTWWPTDGAHRRVTGLNHISALRTNFVIYDDFLNYLYIL